MSKFVNPMYVQQLIYIKKTSVSYVVVEPTVKKTKKWDTKEM